MFGAYLFGVKHYRLPMVRPLFRFELVRAYLFDARLRRLVQAIADEDASLGDLATVWDTNSSALLSRRLFQSVDMNAAHKYMYKPNLRKLMFRTGPAGLDEEIEVEDSPEIRKALREADTSFVAASYDRFGFRRVDTDLTRDCEAHVLFLGDSFTDGMWVSDSETFANRYGHLVRERSNVRVCPVNAGVNGYGSLEEAYVLEHSFETAGEPRVVFVMYFANDVDADYVAVIEGTVADGPRKWTESLSYLRQAVRFSRQHGATLVLAAIPPVEQLSRPSTRKNYQDVLRRFCEAEAIPFIDLLVEFGAVDRRGLYLDWDPHFTARGHEVVAGILYEETKALLGTVRDASTPRKGT